MYLDNLIAGERLAVRRCAERSRSPGLATAAGPHGAATDRWRSSRPLSAHQTASQRDAQTRASFSSTTAVGLLSPRSMSESIERLTPLLVASASRELCSHAVAHTAGDAPIEIGC